MTRVRTDQYSGYSMSAGKGWLAMSSHGSGDAEYWMGTFFHPVGIVDVYRQADFTSLRFAYDGRVFVRQWDGAFKDRTIPSLARQFVADVLEDEI